MPLVRFETKEASFTATIEDGTIARAIFKQLPVKSRALRWGDEIYFNIPVKMSNTRPTTQVGIGDIAYWPEGPCLCVFFGKTPMSKAEEPRPASDVTIVGHTDAAGDLLRAVRNGATIQLSHASLH